MPHSFLPYAPLPSPFPFMIYPFSITSRNADTCTKLISTIVKRKLKNIFLQFAKRCHFGFLAHYTYRNLPFFIPQLSSQQKIEKSAVQQSGINPANSNSFSHSYQNRLSDMNVYSNSTPEKSLWIEQGTQTQRGAAGFRQVGGFQWSAV